MHTFFCAEFIRHFDFGTGVFRGRFSQLLEKSMLILVMRLATRGNVGVDAAFLTSRDVGFAEVTIIQSCGFWFSDGGRNGIQGRSSSPPTLGKGTLLGTPPLIGLAERVACMPGWVRPYT